MVALTAVIVAIVTLILAHNSSEATRNVHKGAVRTKLTAEQSQGRRLFNVTCAGCHTLAAANAVGLVGPNLDQLRPSRLLVETAVRVGFTVPQGVMPAGLLTGPDVTAVADFVAHVTNTPTTTTPAPAPAAGGSTTSTSASTGASTGASTTPAAGGAGNVTAGAAVFSQNCAACHGPRGLGGGGGPNLTTMPLARTVAGVTQQVTNGGGGMPAFRGTLSDQQIADVAAFVTQTITRGR